MSGTFATSMAMFLAINAFGVLRASQQGELQPAGKPALHLPVQPGA